MKVLITEDTLDSLLSIKISSDGGKTYTDYSVSSLKDGLTLDCSPKDLKVICDVNTLKYIQVLADGEKNVNLSDYIKFKDVYIDVYKNPYYGVELPKEEVDNLSEMDRTFYMYRNTYSYYCSSKNFMILTLKFYTILVPSKDDSFPYSSSEFFVFSATNDKKNNNFFLDYNVSNHLERLDDFYYVYYENNLSSETFQTNVRVHFIKHF